jgi:pyridoxal phosphate enzyme (YggS family)
VTETVANRIEQVQERIRAALSRAQRADEVTLVAVSKTFPAEAIAEAYGCGVRHFGENRVQEFEGKRPNLDLPDATFHLIGHLQSNKARKAVELFGRIDSVDSLSLAQRLGKVAEEAGREIPVLLQIHLGEEATKSGILPAEAVETAQQMAGINGLRLDGLMAIPPFMEEPEQARPYFRQLRELAEEIDRVGISGVSMKTLSMGMTHDFEVAIEEGATEIRAGTAIFGERPPLGKAGGGA